MRKNKLFNRKILKMLRFVTAAGAGAGAAGSQMGRPGSRSRQKRGGTETMLFDLIFLKTPNLPFIL